LNLQIRWRSWGYPSYTLFIRSRVSQVSAVWRGPQCIRQCHGMILYPCPALLSCKRPAAFNFKAVNQPQKELKRQWTVRPSGCQGMWRIPLQIIVRLSGIGLPHHHHTVQRRFQECSAAHPGIASAHSPVHQAIVLQPVHTCGCRTRCNCVIAIHAPYGGCKSLFLQDMQTDSWRQLFANSLLRSPEAFAATDLLHQLTRTPSILHPDPKFQTSENNTHETRTERQGPSTGSTPFSV